MGAKSGCKKAFEARPKAVSSIPLGEVYWARGVDAAVLSLEQYAGSQELDKKSLCQVRALWVGINEPWKEQDFAKGTMA